MNARLSPSGQLNTRTMFVIDNANRVVGMFNNSPGVGAAFGFALKFRLFLRQLMRRMLKSLNWPHSKNASLSNCPSAWPPRTTSVVRSYLLF